MNRSIAVAVAFALCTAACASETEENEPTQERSEQTPVAEPELSPNSIGYCRPQKLPICNDGFTCMCNSSGLRVCYCN